MLKIPKNTEITENTAKGYIKSALMLWYIYHKHGAIADKN